MTDTTPNKSRPVAATTPPPANRDRATVVDDLVETVRDMRAFQREYFAKRSPYWLNRARETEKRVDRLLEELDETKTRNLF